MTSVEKNSFFDSCLLQLQGWFFNLPKELRIKPTDRSEHLNASPQVYVLNMVHYTSLILLSKPFIPTKNTRTSNLSSSISNDKVPKRAFDLCQEAATEISDIGDRFREKFGTFRR